MASRSDPSRPPSSWWLVVAVVIGALAAASFVAAIVHQTSATEPIGEGEVFQADSRKAAGIIEAADTPESGVRHARNDLDVEAVSVVNGDGMVIASTSDTLTGRPLSDPLLEYGAGFGRFAALATAVGSPIQIDGVTEWAAGSILYQVISPLQGEDRLVLLHYDVSQLLSRRTQPGDIQPLTIQLLALGGIFVVLATAVGIGHSRATRRHRQLVIESELLRSHAKELEQANVELAEARQRAERALSLSEEKMRIRSEFVLMINHELRTPLTSVVTGAELLRHQELSDAEREEVLESMVANGKRLSEIIDQILAVARIENRGLSNELVAVPLDEACVAAGADLVDRERARSTLVCTDVRTLSLILSSLSDNALTHGATEVTTRCVSKPEIEGMLAIGDTPPRPVYFLVADNGPGIDPEFLPRAFEKFEKNSMSSGTGIGLYMVKLMVEAIGGSIEVRTSPQGTTFQIALPSRVDDRVMVSG